MLQLMKPCCTLYPHQKAEDAHVLQKSHTTQSRTSNLKFAELDYLLLWDRDIGAGRLEFPDLSIRNVSRPFGSHRCL